MPAFPGNPILPRSYLVVSRDLWWSFFFALLRTIGRETPPVVIDQWVAFYVLCFFRDKSF